MKKNVMMRTATVLLVAVLLTTCAIGGTFAKYATSTNAATDSARVAYWGFDQDAAITIDNLFINNYGDAVGAGGDAIIAPGTTGSASFAFHYTTNTEATAPEVDYTFAVTVNAECDDLIKANTNIVWKLDNVAAPAVGTEGDPGYLRAGSFDALVHAIKLLSGDANGSKAYTAGNLPAAFNNNQTHIISWEWAFTETNENNMGNAATLDNVSITIQISATQTNS